MFSKTIYSIFSLLILGTCFEAQAAYMCGKAAQGEILSGYAPEAKSIIFGGQKYDVSPQGVFLLAFGRDDKPSQSFFIVDAQGQKNKMSLEIKPTKWDVQSLKGVPPRKVEPSDADTLAIDKEQKLLRAALQTDAKEAHWQKGFIEPVKGRISGKFGGQRIMNGVKKNPHAGMDIAAPQGTPVAASGDGIVVLSAPDMFYSGNVIVIDHGYGLHTIYAHLQQMNVKRDDIVKQGDIIGLVGQTGRSTGPHLHWGAALKGVKFNPTSLLNLNNSDDFCFNL